MFIGFLTDDRFYFISWAHSQWHLNHLSTSKIHHYICMFKSLWGSGHEGKAEIWIYGLKCSLTTLLQANSIYRHNNEWIYSWYECNFPPKENSESIFKGLVWFCKREREGELVGRGRGRRRDRIPAWSPTWGFILTPRSWPGLKSRVGHLAD